MATAPGAAKAKFKEAALLNRSRDLSNGDGMATLAAIEGLPIAGDVRRMIKGKPRPSEDLKYFPHLTISVKLLDPLRPRATSPTLKGVSLYSPESAFPQKEEDIAA